MRVHWVGMLLSIEIPSGPLTRFGEDLTLPDSLPLMQEGYDGYRMARVLDYDVTPAHLRVTLEVEAQRNPRQASSTTGLSGDCATLPQ